MRKKSTQLDVEEFAKNVQAIFEAFLKVGFTTQQAFDLTLLVIQRP